MLSLANFTGAVERRWAFARASAVVGLIRSRLPTLPKDPT